MVSAPLLISESSTPSQTCLAAELPDEILDDIIRLAGPRYHTLPRMSKMYRRALRNWLPCTMVCRRWYRIGIPYLFRFVQIVDASPGYLEDFCNVVQENACIAHVVQGISIDVDELELDTLASLLHYLPHLRYLTIHVNTMHPGDKLHGCYALEKLVYENYTLDDGPSSFQWEVIELLQLFNDVVELELGPNFCRQSGSNELQTAVVAPWKPRIQALKLACFEYNNASYLTCLYDSHAFDNLTCLSIWITSLLKVDSLNQMLLYVGATLGELYLYLNLDECEDTSEFGREHVANTLRNGFTACTVLHGFRVEMTSTFTLWGDWTREQICECAVDDWLLALNLFALVAELHCGVKGGPIRHLAFSYHSCTWRYEGHGFEVLPWERMRVVFGKFVDLSTLTVVFDYAHVDELTGREDEDGTPLPTAKAYARKELEIFKKILYDSNHVGYFFACRQKSCRWNVPRHRHKDTIRYLKFK